MSELAADITSCSATFSRACVVRITTVALAFASGCGSNDDSFVAPDSPEIGGLYQVTHHTSNPDNCDAEGLDVVDPPYFRLKLGEALGKPYYEFEACTQADVATCTAGDFVGLQIQEETAWRGEAFMSVGGDNGIVCELSAVLTTATPDENGIHLESHEYRMEDSRLVGDSCNAQVAQERGATMPCEAFEVYDGTRVPIR